MTPAAQALARELYRAPGFFGHRNSTLISILQQMGATGEPAVIRVLMPFGLSEKSEVRQTAREVIHRLFALVPLTAIPALDESLRQTGPYVETYHDLLPHAIPDLALSGIPDRTFLGLLASHRNGFVRAEMVRRMATSDSADFLPFLVVRLTDWAEKVQDAAMQALQAKLVPRYSVVFVECLELLERQKQSSRFPTECAAEIEVHLRSMGSGPAVRLGMSHASLVIARQCFRLAVSHPAFSTADVLAQGIRHRDAALRKWAFGASVSLLPTIKHRALTAIASRDPFGPIRRMAFDRLVADRDSEFAQLEPFLLDRSTGIRRDAQAAVAKRWGRSVAEYYRGVLGERTKSRAVSLLGLAETGTTSDAAVVLRYLDHPASRVRRAVLRALSILGCEPATDDVLQLMSSDVLSVAREAARLLLRSTPADAVWAAAARNPNPAVRGGVLPYLTRAGKWSQFRHLLQGAVDAEPSVSAKAIVLLEVWVKRFNTSFARPGATDRALIPGLYASASKRFSPALNREVAFILENAFRPGS